jgi:molybdopterin-containing oxidoreductase family iron-sulfur binding subunit
MKINTHEARNKNEPLDITKVRERLKNDRGKQTWRSLEELADTATFQEFLKEEFPNQSSLAQTINSISRREFLKLMGASLVLAGLNACVAQPSDQILPYVEAPQGLVPGKPLHYATAMEMNGYALGLVVKSREGRPIKVEGNPKHPASLGATDVFAQASTLDLYDPDRTQVITHKGEIQTWDNFLAVLTQAVSDLGAKSGAGLHILSGSTSSPTMLSQMKAVQDKFPQAHWHQYDPIGRAAAR